MTPVEIYDAMSDVELLDFAADRLPGLLWRLEKKPRCWICREAIVDELQRRPMFVQFPTLHKELSDA